MTDIASKRSPTQVDKFFDFLSLHMRTCREAHVDLDPPIIAEDDGARVRAVCLGCRDAFDARLTPAEINEFLFYAEHDQHYEDALRRAERRVVQ